MEGIPVAANGSIVCPECGKQHARARQLLYTRRRWFVAAFSLSVVSISWYALAFHWRFRERGWMGYVPTTVLVVLPASADAWLTSADYSGKSPKLVREVWYREFVGMRVWQDHLWVQNLQRRVEANSKETDLKLRFVLKPDRGIRQWKRHRCQASCGAPLYYSTPPRPPCPGNGAWYIHNQEDWFDDSVECAVWISSLVHGIDYRIGHRSDLRVILEVDLSNYWLLPKHSAYAAYQATDRGYDLVREGQEFLSQPAGWRSDTGLTGIPDIPCTIEGQPGFIRKFDLSPTIETMYAVNQYARTRRQDWALVAWFRLGIFGGLESVEVSERRHPHACVVNDRSLFVASTREGIDEVTRRLEEFHTKAPALWRELQDE